MTKFLITLLVLLGFLPTSIFSQDTKSKDVAISVGDDAPDWTMTGTDGKEYKLSDFKDKKAVVVAWYPMALTGG